jgi:hypothetical protein
LGSCDWDKEIVGAPNKSISASKFRSQVASRVTSEAVTYLTSHVNRATMGYLLDPQAIGASAPRNRYPLIDLQVDISPAQSESV